MARCRYHRVGAEKEPACDRIPSIADHIGIAQETRKAVPIDNVQLCFGAVDDRLAERYGKADGGIVDLIVVRIVVHQPTKVIRVQLELSEEGLGQSQLIVVSIRWLDR